MRIVCCIVAAGEGTRLGDAWAGTPKALVPLLGRPMLYYSLHVLDLVEGISSIVVAAPPNAVDRFRGEISIWGFSKPVTVVAGGATRSQSVRNCLESLQPDLPETVVIHDAARACVARDMVDALLKASGDGTAATLAAKVPDTFRLFENGYISGELDRSRIAAIETPQAFRCAELLELHRGADERDLPDDSTLFTRAGKPVRVVFHEGCNLKITFPEDIGAAEGVLFGRGWQDASEGDE